VLNECLNEFVLENSTRIGMPTVGVFKAAESLKALLLVPADIR
jgi:hypothetical protein